MPKHRGVLDKMKYVRILLDDPSIEWREPSFTESCLLLMGNMLPSELHPSTILEIAS